MIHCRVYSIGPNTYKCHDCRRVYSDITVLPLRARCRIKSGAPTTSIICSKLGKPLGKVTCDNCPSTNVGLTTFVCELHGECVPQASRLRNPDRPVRLCYDCTDFKAKQQ